jgi:hypothetical protein
MRKLFTSAVVVLTIIWAVGLAAFVPTAQAVALNSGDLIKASLPAVYYYGADAKRYVFPDEKTYKTWYGDFSSVITITDEELAMIQIGGNVTYRPGVKMIKITTDPKVYAVDVNGTLRWVSTEAVASCLYGTGWGSMVQDVPDPFFVNYTIGAEITDCADFDKDAASAAAPTINVDKGLGGAIAGDVMASLAADNPSGATLPVNATGVEVLKFNLTGTGDVANITFKAEGVGNTGDIANAYLYEGAVRLTSGKSFNSTTKEATFNVSRSVPVTLSLVIDISGTALAGDEHAFKILAINGVAAGGVMGNTFSIGSQAVSNVTIAPSTIPVNPQVGSQGAEIANFRITGGVNDSVINSITLSQVGSINSDDLTNFVLEQAGVEVASADAILSGDRIVLVFSSPYSLLSGAQRTFTLYADVAGRPGRTISLYLDETQDLVAIDSLYGFGATVTSTFTAGTMAITSEGGEITVAFNGPVTGDVSRGALDAVLFEFAMTSVAPVDVRNTWLSINGTGVADFLRGSAGTYLFSDVKLINADTGQVLAGPVSMATANLATASGTLQMTDDWSLDGTVNLAITADIRNSEDLPNEFFNVPGNSYSVTLGAGGALFNGGADIKYQDSNDYVAGADIVPNTPIVGNAQSVLSSSLTIDVSSFVGASTYVRGATDAASAAFVATAGSDSDVRITRLVLNPIVDTDALATPIGTAGSDVTADNVAVTAKLWQITDAGWTQLDGTKSIQIPVGGLAGSETVTFDNFEVIVPAGDSAVFAVTFDASTSYAFVGGELLQFNINVPANVLAYDKDDNTVTPTLATAPAALIGPNTTINAVGTIDISSDISDPAYRERLVQMGSSGQKALRVKARATFESFRMTDTLFTVNTNPANVLTVDISYPTDADQTTYESKSSVVAGVGGNAAFAGMNWYIPSDIDSYMDVTISVNNDTNGATSGNTPFTIQLEAQDADLLAAFTKPLGLSSGNFAIVNSQLVDIDSVGNQLLARKSIVTVSKNAASPSGTAIPGLDEYLRVDLTNGGTSAVNVMALTLRLNSADTGNGQWICTGVLPALPSGPVIEIYDINDASTPLVNTALGTDVSGCAGGDADATEYRILFTNPIAVSPGTTKTLKVQVDTSIANALTDDTFRIDVVANDLIGAAAVGSDFEWNDGIAPTATANNNGYKVESLPVTGGNFVF